MFSIRRSDRGIAGDSLVTGPTLFVITAFISLALYNVLELIIIIFTKFKKRRGLYFWSMLVATIGISFNAVGYLLKFLHPNVGLASRLTYVSLVLVGWSSMITGQSVVLYSRLHLLLHNQRKLRFILGMIIFDAIVCHIPISVLFYSVSSENGAPFVMPYSIYEKVQLSVFFVQECIISFVYIQESWKFLQARHLGFESSNKNIDGRKIMYWLIFINVIIMTLDISILVLEFSGFYDLQTSWKALVYSVKLKLEFSILNKLIEVVKARNPDLFDSEGIRMTLINGGKRPINKSSSGGKSLASESAAQASEQRGTIAGAEEESIPGKNAIGGIASVVSVSQDKRHIEKDVNSSRWPGSYGKGVPLY
ncbi:hypothetical protein KVR01_010947 [Diaporthe batatas]|uniref:uncharacterized protein n=1 Tax=Diaporthe batatas TaxID=748121 RepID=UPI001D05BDBA|nr:uncharacterized protein KVR01_010947 [Diaporthe batatas]KAG8159286.1 hypothetical protein KVR01_010947 [Diaporthe batatas]